MPAVRAAAAFAPTARSEKPSVERVSSHQQPAAAASAIRMPTLTGSPSPNRCGSRALPWIVRETACAGRAFWKPLTLSR